jgi:hypothetical protein
MLEVGRESVLGTALWPELALVESFRDRDGKDGPFTVFKLVLRRAGDAAHGGRWSNEKRYSQFLTLHNSVKDDLRSKGITMPGKRRFRLNTAQKEKRRIQLQHYLQQVLRARADLSPQATTNLGVFLGLHRMEPGCGLDSPDFREASMFAFNESFGSPSEIPAMYGEDDSREGEAAVVQTPERIDLLEKKLREGRITQSEYVQLRKQEIKAQKLNIEKKENEFTRASMPLENEVTRASALSQTAATAVSNVAAAWVASDTVTKELAKARDDLESKDAEIDAYLAELGVKCQALHCSQEELLKSKGKCVQAYQQLQALRAKLQSRGNELNTLKQELTHKDDLLHERDIEIETLRLEFVRAAPIVLSVVDVEEVRPAGGTAYKVFVLRMSKAGHEWTLRKRYSEIRALKNTLPPDATAGLEFPGRTLFGMHGRKLHKRRVELEKFLNGMLARNHHDHFLTRSSSSRQLKIRANSTHGVGRIEAAGSSRNDNQTWASTSLLCGAADALVDTEESNEVKRESINLFLGDQSTGMHSRDSNRDSNGMSIASMASISNWGSNGRIYDASGASSGRLMSMSHDTGRILSISTSDDASGASLDHFRHRQPTKSSGSNELHGVRNIGLGLEDEEEGTESEDVSGGAGGRPGGARGWKPPSQDDGEGAGKGKGNTRRSRLGSRDRSRSQKKRGKQKSLLSPHLQGFAMNEKVRAIHADCTARWLLWQFVFLISPTWRF